VFIYGYPFISALACIVSGRTPFPHRRKLYLERGRPPKVSHFQVFSAILYVLRTGIPWHDVPLCYGHWHTIYLRFKRGSEKGLWWRILYNLQRRKKIKLKVILADSTTFKVHRHGGDKKGAILTRKKSSRYNNQTSPGYRKTEDWLCVMQNSMSLSSPSLPALLSKLIFTFDKNV
jgi:transposase